MHDPLVVAFEIRRPWPRRSKSYDAKPGKSRWKVRGPFWTLAGRGFYWPAMVTVWHREPGGKDSGEVCKHYVRTQSADGTWSTRILHGWRWHVRHWRIQVGPLQTLRRWALTRCAWCGGRSRDGDRANISHQWNGQRAPWWRGERGLFHQDCSSIERAHRMCLCADPLLAHGSYGRCAWCGKARSYGATTLQFEQARILVEVPSGQRNAAAYQRVCDLYTESTGADA